MMTMMMDDLSLDAMEQLADASRNENPALQDPFDIAEFIHQRWSSSMSAVRRKLFFSLWMRRLPKDASKKQEDDATTTTTPAPSGRVDAERYSQALLRGPGASTPSVMFPSPQPSSEMTACASAGLLVIPAEGTTIKSPIRSEGRRGITITSTTTTTTTTTTTNNDDKLSEGPPPSLSVLSVTPFIEVDIRCQVERMPTMAMRPRVAAPQTIPCALQSAAGEAQYTAAWKIYLKAEDLLERGQVGDEWDSAVGLFESSSRRFLAAARGGVEHDEEAVPPPSTPKRGGGASTVAALDVDAVNMAANALVRCADCRRCLMDTDAMASFLCRAAEVYAMSPTHLGDAAIKAMTQSVYVSWAEGRRVKAAKYCRRAAEIAVDANRLDTAVEFLHTALDWYTELGMLGEARASMARATAIYLMDLLDPASAIDALEKLADVSLPDEQPLVLFRAMLCRLACIPPSLGVDTDEAIRDCIYSLDQYTDLCVALCSGKENKCLKAVIRGVEENKPQMVEEALLAYRDTHSLEEWVPSIMELIFNHTVRRLAHQMERTREVPR